MESNNKKMKWVHLIKDSILSFIGVHKNKNVYQVRHMKYMQEHLKDSDDYVIAIYKKVEDRFDPVCFSIICQLRHTPNHIRVYGENKKLMRKININQWI